MRWLNAMSAVVLLAYPLVVYYGLNRWGLNLLAAILALFFLLRLVAARKTRLADLKPLAWAGGVSGILLVGAGALLRREGLLLFYPVLINVIMLVLFLHSLRRPRPLIEQFARLEKPDLSPAEVSYANALTRIWCGFFVLNGLVALATCFVSRQAWMLYNGLISYLLVGSLFLGERLVREQILEKYFA